MTVRKKKIAPKITLNSRSLILTGQTRYRGGYRVDSMRIYTPQEFKDLIIKRYQEWQVNKAPGLLTSSHQHIRELAEKHMASIKLWVKGTHTQHIRVFELNSDTPPKLVRNIYELLFEEEP